MGPHTRTDAHTPDCAAACTRRKLASYGMIDSQEGCLLLARWPDQVSRWVARTIQLCTSLRDPYQVVSLRGRGLSASYGSRPRPSVIARTTRRPYSIRCAHVYRTGQGAWRRCGSRYPPVLLPAFKCKATRERAARFFSVSSASFQTSRRRRLLASFLFRLRASPSSAWFSFLPLGCPRLSRR